MQVDKKILLVRTIGNFILLGSVVSILFTFWPVISAYTTHAIDNMRGEKFEAVSQVSTTQTFGSLLGKPDPNLKILVPKDPNFSIIVEKIGANAPIIPNVDPTNKAIYDEALKRGVAHSLGSSFPGEAGVTYLFAHSTDTIWDVPRFNAVFYLLNDMNPGDRIVVFFNGKRYDYLTTEKKNTERCKTTL